MIKRILGMLGGRSSQRYGLDSQDPFSFVNLGFSSSSVRRNAGAWLRAFEGNIRVRAVVSRIALDVAKIPFFLLRDTAKGLQEVTDHDWLTWQASPWRTEGGGSWQDLLWLTTVWGELDGNAYWWLKRDKVYKDKIVEVLPIPPTWVTRQPANEDMPWRITLPDGKMTADIPLSDMLWFRWPSPVNPWGAGVGHAAAADDEVTQDEAYAKWNNAFLRNGARPDMIVFLDGLKTGKEDRVRASWEERHQGFDNAFRVHFMNASGKVQQLGFSHKDMDFLEGRRFARDAIFQLWQVPPEIMGVVENSNRATAEAALFMYASSVILPRVIHLCWNLNRLLLPAFRKADGLQLAFENPVQETAEFQRVKYTDAFKSGIITRNESRAGLGFDPLPDARGDEILVPTNMQPLRYERGRASEEVDGRPYRKLFVATKSGHAKEVRVYADQAA